MKLKTHERKTRTPSLGSWLGLLFLAAAAALAWMGYRSFESERSRAREDARKTLRAELLAARLRLEKSAAELRGREGAQLIVDPAGKVIEPPPGLKLEGLRWRGRDERGSFFITNADSLMADAPQKNYRRARELDLMAAGPDRDPVVRAAANHRLFALAERFRDDDPLPWCRRLVALLPDLPASARMARECLIMRARVQPYDPQLPTDLAALLNGRDAIIAAGLIESAGLSQHPIVVRRRLAIETHKLLRTLLPRIAARDEGYTLSGSQLAAWTTRQGNRWVSTAPLPALGRRVIWTPRREEEKEGEIEEGLDLPLGGALVARADTATLERTADSRALLTSAFLFLLLLAGTVALSLSVSALKRQREASSARAEFLARTGHDLRTPLASIRMYAETLASGRVEKAEEREEFAAIIAEEAGRLSRLADHALDFERREHRPVPEDLDLTALIRNVAASFEALFAKDDFLLELALPKEAITIHGDPAALRSVIANLLENAWHHARSGGKLRLCCTQRDGQIRIQLRDWGPGVPEEEREQIFDRFARGHNAQGRGTGLGLALVKEVWESHGGRIRVHSAPEGGAIFELNLPIQTQDHDLKS